MSEQHDTTLLKTRLTTLVDAFLSHVKAFDTKELEGLSDAQLADLLSEYVETQYALESPELEPLGS